MTKLSNTPYNFRLIDDTRARLKKRVKIFRKKIDKKLTMSKLINDILADAVKDQQL